MKIIETLRERYWMLDQMHLHGRLRASVWLLLAMLGGCLLWFAFGGVQYLGAWIGALAKAASGAWGGYWISRNVVRADPSARDTESERNADKLARAIVVAATVLAVCIAV